MNDYENIYIKNVMKNDIHVTAGQHLNVIGIVAATITVEQNACLTIKGMATNVINYGNTFVYGMVESLDNQDVCEIHGIVRNVCGKPCVIIKNAVVDGMRY